MTTPDTRNNADTGLDAVTEAEVDLALVAQKEAAERPERIAALTAQVDELFPGENLAELREDVTQRSFNTPQYGDYHTEGLFMDSHLARILSAVDDVAAGRFAPGIPKDIQNRMQLVGVSARESLLAYTFLHDITKPDSLTIKFADDRKNESVSWEQWQERIPEAAKSDPQALKAYCEEQGISGIGYFGHAKSGKERLETFKENLDLPDVLFTAVEKHMVANQFNKVNIKTFRKHLGNLSEDELSWALTASYIDTMGSLSKNGQSDLSNFMFLVDTIHNMKVISDASSFLWPAEGSLEKGLDKGKLQAEIVRLEKLPTRIDDTADVLAGKMREVAKIPRYDKEKLEASLRALSITKQIPKEVIPEILAAINDDGTVDSRKMGPIRGKLRAANRLVNAALEDSKIK